MVCEFRVKYIDGRGELKSCVISCDFYNLPNTLSGYGITGAQNIISIEQVV